VAAFTRAGGEVVTSDPYLDDLPSFRPYLERLQRRGGADILLIAGTRAGGVRILATRDSLGLALPTLGGDGLAGIEEAGAAADGVYISTAYLPDQEGAANAAFVEAYRAASGNRLPDHRGAGTYDAVRLIARAVGVVGPDRARLRDYLAGVGTTHAAFAGVTGRIAFDENGDVPEKPIAVGVVQGGVLRAVGGS
jgi:branched-chain amino acid transport system substrate-binding protein